MACSARVPSSRSNGRLKVHLDLEDQCSLPLRIVPVLPQENPATLEARIDRYIEDLQPRNAAEADLVAQAARLSWMIERSDRLEKAHMAHRVRKQELRGGQASTRQFQQAEELGRKLFYDARPVRTGGIQTPPPRWVDEPAVFLRKLEHTADGCRWLLKRWMEFRNLLERKVKWLLTDLFRFVRLQGKHGVEAVNDPDLNVFFLAWDVIWPGIGLQFWKASRKHVTDRDPGLNATMSWREIADRPADVDQAWTLLRAEVNQRIEQLSASLGEFARVAAADAADRAALDLSPGLARHRRDRTAMGRELLRILDALRKMAGSKQMANGECQMANGECQMANGECQMANGECQMANGECQMANGEWQMANGECQMANGKCQTRNCKNGRTEKGNGATLGHDFDAVINQGDDAANGCARHHEERHPALHDMVRNGRGSHATSSSYPPIEKSQRNGQDVPLSTTGLPDNDVGLVQEGDGGSSSERTST